MFGFSSKKSEISVVSPVDGQAIEIKDVPDQVFSEKILGDGIGLKPSNGEVFSPVDGEIIQVAETSHAIGIATKQGLEFLIHMGLETVSLKGEGFKVFVKEGEKVKVGTKLMEMDIDFVSSKGLNPTSVLVLTNGDDVKNFEKIPGQVKAKETVIAKIQA